MKKWINNLCETEGKFCTCFWDGSWSLCCKRHDRRYENTRLTRKQADTLLYRCVRRKNRFIAPIMYIGVRLFGKSRYERITS